MYDFILIHSIYQMLSCSSRGMMLPLLRFCLLTLSFPPLGQGCFKYPAPGPLPLTNGLLFNLTPFLFYAFSNTICYVKLPITDRDYLVKCFFI